MPLTAGHQTCEAHGIASLLLALIADKLEPRKLANGCGELTCGDGCMLD